MSCLGRQQRVVEHRTELPISMCCIYHTICFCVLLLYICIASGSRLATDLRVCAIGYLENNNKIDILPQMIEMFGNKK